MTFRTLLVLFSLWLPACTWGEQRYPVTALVLKIDRSHSSIVASCTEIPGYMEAMVMPIPIHDRKSLEAAQTGPLVDFTLVVTDDDSFGENLRPHRYRSTDVEPLQVRRLELMANLDHPESPVAEVALGQPVPDFTLTDQTGVPVSVAQFRGKVVAVAFIYTRCPLPNYCFRLSNNLRRVQKRFEAKLGRDLVLLTITMDPVHDTVDQMAQYAAIWHADANSWHFLTGPPPEVKSLCRRFGVNFWPDEGTLTHSLHTILIDREGNLAANFEGNEFTAEQLGDFVQVLLNQ